MSIATKLRKLKNANYRETEPLQLPDGMLVVISSLTGADDKAIADYLREHLGKSLGHYTKLESLAYAIKWIQPAEGEPIDLRNLTHIETGEVLGNGKPIKLPRAIFMREIVDSWPDVVIDTLFARYAQLMDDIDKSLSKTIKVELGDTSLQMKVQALSDELRDLVQQAQQRDVKLDDELVRVFGGGTLDNPSSDALLRAIRLREEALAPAPEPAEEVHPVDEQLAREREENPEVYPVPLAPEPEVVDEAPQSIRK